MVRRTFSSAESGPGEGRGMHCGGGKREERKVKEEEKKSGGKGGNKAPAIDPCSGQLAMRYTISFEVALFYVSKPNETLSCPSCLDEIPMAEPAYWKPMNCSRSEHPAT
ncbi:hypothetical protein THAOC_27417 [Thalassiosira oceanica]|uniref:Uncharacterized protein n=1 Tax=Thalassiosira oceanica TaxID=159749 RepID=K0S2X6_THAOC|nr:hypothetical protein THAOC_27417 [Thalassiosira oceanica]|eukprot:EJK53202.1 hypothetical protein THAOC_27417 [Thalassiosira oceanica]